jgi:CheY-like chemotaxis protein
LVAETVRSALQLLKLHQPDAVVSDVGLPNEDGHELVRNIRRLEPADGGTTPALAVTAYAGLEHRRAALAAGFDDYLTKPVDVAEFVEALAQLLRGPRSGLR